MPERYLKIKSAINIARQFGASKRNVHCHVADVADSLVKATLGPQYVRLFEALGLPSDSGPLERLEHS